MVGLDNGWTPILYPCTRSQQNSAHILKLCCFLLRPLHTSRIYCILTQLVLALYLLNPFLEPVAIGPLKLLSLNYGIPAPLCCAASCDSIEDLALQTAFWLAHVCPLFAFPIVILCCVPNLDHCEHSRPLVYFSFFWQCVCCYFYLAWSTLWFLHLWKVQYNKMFKKEGLKFSTLIKLV